MLTEDQLKALEQVEQGQEDTLSTTDDVIIDLGNYGAAQDTLMIDSGIDTVTLTGASGASTISTISIPSFTTSYQNATYNNNYTISGVTGTWGNPSISIGENGIDMPDGKDIKIGDRSLKEFMTKMEERLAILVPDPAKLEKFEALKKAYEHYKTMESLCFPDEKDKKE